MPPREPPLPDGEPEAKRLRTDTFVLAPEEEFADAHPGTQTVRLPAHGSAFTGWGLCCFPEGWARVLGFARLPSAL